MNIPNMEVSYDDSDGQLQMGHMKSTIGQQLSIKVNTQFELHQQDTKDNMILN